MLSPALVIPISSPFELNSPPPEFPEYRAVSILILLYDLFVPSMSRVMYSLSTLTIPSVTEIPSSSGLPIAIAVCPT